MRASLSLLPLNPPSNMISVRRLLPAEWALAFPLIAQLRNLDEAEFLRRARRQAHGGELVGAYLNDALVGVMGMRPVHTLARGPPCTWTIWWWTRPCEAAARDMR